MKLVLLRDATLAFETSEDRVKNLTATKYSVEFIEKYMGHTITTQEFIDSSNKL